jgi:flagellar biosynthetic protein FliP
MTARPLLHLALLLAGFVALAASGAAQAQAADPGLFGGLKSLAEEGGDRGALSLSLQVLLLMGLLTVLPSVILMMTAFLRIIIVLAILRQAIGLQQAPPNQLLVGLALFMTFFVMQPAFADIQAQALNPWVADAITADVAIVRAGDVLHGFMMANTRTTDLKLFADMAGMAPFPDPEAVPMRILMPAFATSELKTAFQIGVLLFLPFLVIDLVVASVLMALGMMMVSPIMIALPFKLMLFVAVDGWALVMASLAASFAGG